MAKFKIVDRVRVVRRFDGYFGCWMREFVGKIGTVENVSESPWVYFDNGGRDYGSEEYLMLLEHAKKDDSAPKTETQPMIVNINIGAELTHITMGGKRFRLVPED